MERLICSVLLVALTACNSPSRISQPIAMEYLESVREWRFSGAELSKCSPNYIESLTLVLSEQGVWSGELIMANIDFRKAKLWHNRIELALNRDDGGIDVQLLLDATIPSQSRKKFQIHAASTIPEFLPRLDSIQPYLRHACDEVK